MIKKLLSLCSILIFLLFTGCFQKTVDSSKLEKRNGTVYQVGEKKPFTGVMKNFYSNGQLAVMEKFKKGKNHGKCEKYYTNGKLWIEYSYKGGNLHGKYMEYFEHLIKAFLTQQKAFHRK